MTEGQTLSPKEITSALSTISEKKAAANVWQQFSLAILAGIYIGFGAAAATVVTAGNLDPGLSKFLGGSIFSVGLMLVLIPGSELFTGNVLMTTGFLARRIRPLRIGRNWLFVWLGNFAGAMLLAWVMNQTGLLVKDGNILAAGANAINIAEAKLALGANFLQCFTRGVLCNMLVCLAVIMACSAKTTVGKILGVYFPIMTFVACGFEHSIANMYFLPTGLMAAGQLGARFWEMFGNLIPVTLGNIVGGLAIIALHPQNQRLFAALFRRKKS